jgi:hypothetical protein
MTWKYALRPVVIFDGEYHNTYYQMVEDYSNHDLYKPDGCYAQLNANDWIFETKTEAIETLKMMLKDIEDVKD